MERVHVIFNTEDAEGTEKRRSKRAKKQQGGSRRVDEKSKRDSSLCSA
jgi:hypothetical protein